MAVVYHHGNCGGDHISQRRGIPSLFTHIRLLFNISILCRSYIPVIVVLKLILNNMLSGLNVMFEYMP